MTLNSPEYRYNRRKLTPERLFLSDFNRPFEGEYDCPNCSEPFYDEEWWVEFTGNTPEDGVWKYICPDCETNSVVILR